MIYGPVGVGKTYASAAIFAYLCDKVRHFRIYKEDKLLAKLRNSISTLAGDYISHCESLLDDELIFIDDLGSVPHNDWREEVLLAAVDCRYRERAKTVITTNLGPLEMKEAFGMRIADRLFAKENTIISLNGEVNLRDLGL